MTQRKHNTRGLLVAAGLLLLMGGGAGAQLRSPNSDNETAGSGNYVYTRSGNSRLEARLFTDRRQYVPGRAVDITMTLTNLTDQMTTVMTGDHFEYDFAIRDERTGRVVYTWSASKGHPRNHGLRLNGSETKTYRALWDCRDDRGRRLPTGIYTIEAQIYPMQTLSAQIYLAGNNRDNGGYGDGDRDGGRGDGGGDNTIPPPALPPINNGGNGGGFGDNGGRYGGNRPGIDPLSATLSLDRSAIQTGDTITLTYTVTNRTSQTQNLRFSSGKRWEALAIDPRTGRAQWQLSRGMSYMEMMGRETLAPGASKIYQTQWRVGTEIPAGNYTVKAFLTPLATDRESMPALATASLRVRGNP